MAIASVCGGYVDEILDSLDDIFSCREDYIRKLDVDPKVIATKLRECRDRMLTEQGGELRHGRE